MTPPSPPPGETGPQGRDLLGLFILAAIAGLVIVVAVVIGGGVGN